MKLKQFFLLITTLIIFGRAHAQDLSNIYTPNLFLGTIDVNIPIYEQDGVGARLTYNTKGVPVRELAGVVGSHWNLITGGTISRRVKGIPDEFKYDTDLYVYGDDPEYEAIISKYELYKGRLYEGLEIPIEKLDEKIFRDPESDEYTFSVGSKSFTFYFGRNGNIFTNPKGKIDVYIERAGAYRMPNDQTSMADYNSRIVSHNIKVVDRMDNSVYYFSPSEKTSAIIAPYFTDFKDLKFVNDFYAQSLKFTNAWKLDSFLIDGFTTRLTYKEFYWPNQIYSAHDSSWIARALGSSYSTQVSTGTMKELLFYQVDSIKYHNGVNLVFNYLTSPARADINQQINPTFPYLSNIILNEGNNSIKFLFDYSYFYSQSPFEVANYIGGQADQYSLKLKGIRTSSLDNSVVMPYYTFDYNYKKQRRFGKGLDYYGYYNGGQNFFNVVGHSISNIGASSYDFKGNDISASWGLLNKIENSYGGRVEFKYGIHNIENYANCSITDSNLTREGGSTVDGVRVDSIVNTDMNNPLRRDVTFFEYNQGYLFHIGGYCEDGVTYQQGGSTNITTYNRYEMFSGPTSVFNGNNHGYSNVNVITKNIDGQLLAKKAYEFSNIIDENGFCRTYISGGGKQSIAPPFSEKQYIKDWELGLPISIKEYDNKGFLLSEVKNVYTSILDTTTSINIDLTENSRTILSSNVDLYVDPDGYNSIRIKEYTTLLDPYRPYRGQSLLSKAITHKYESNDKKKSDSVVYFYDNKNNLKSTFLMNSEGSKVILNKLYNYDLSSTTVSSNSTLVQLQNQDREILIGTEKWIRSTDGGGGPIESILANDKLLDASIYNFELKPNGFLATKAIYGLESAEPILGTDYREGMFNPNLSGHISYSQAAKIWSGQPIPNYLVKLTEAQIFDLQNNTVQAFVPEGDINKVNVFDKRTNRIVLEVINAKQNEVAFADFDNAIDGNLVYNQQHIVRLGSSFAPEIPPPTVNGVSKAVSGNNFLAVAASSLSAKAIYTSGLSEGKTYRVTFWATDHSLPQFGIEGGSQFSLVHIATKGKFKQYECIFTVLTGQNTSKFGINGDTNLGIEDLRICPTNAIMQNRVYEPLFGVSATTDAMGRLTYFEYDKIGRLVITRDQDGNILEKKEYGPY